MGCGSEDENSSQATGSSQARCQSAEGCNGGSCQQNQQPQGSFGSWARRQQTATTDTSATAAAGEVELGMCRKCKQRPAVLYIRQQEPYCNECLEAGIQQKVRTATKTQGLVQTKDHVMVAISGGAASLALLSCVVEMKSTVPNRPERGKVPFELTVVHIDSSMAVGRSDREAANHIQQVHASVAAAGYPGRLLVLPLCAVFADQQQLQQQLQPLAAQQLLQQMEQLHVSVAPAQALQQELGEGGVSPAAAAGDALPADAVALGVSDSDAAPAQVQQQQQLIELLCSITDTTGREDLITHLQDQLLQRAAVALGCNRLLLGECASRVAARIIADAAKGRGYSLPADIQHLDARSLPAGGPVVIHPVREVTYKELVALCAYKGIAWQDRPMGQPVLQQQKASSGSTASSGSGRAASAAMSVNTLAEKFIDDMQSTVPGSIYTILRTAAHLQPFGFNDILAVPEAVNASLPPTARAERAKILAQLQNNASSSACVNGSQDGISLQQLCSLCRAPLPAPAATGGTGTDVTAAEARLKLAGLTSNHSKQLCYSCNRQILFQSQTAAGANALDAENGLEARMLRLKQLLPPGLLLED